MKVKLFFIFLMFSFGITAHSLDVSFLYYPPSLFGIVSGEAATTSRFENYGSDRRLLIPIEVKFCVLDNGLFSISTNTIFSAYIEDGLFSSLNFSAGSCFFLKNTQTTSMTGAFLTLYPVYEIPFLSLGKEPLFGWKLAADLGYSIVLFNFIEINFYTRGIFAWLGPVFGVLPDVGMSLGIRLY